MGFSMLDALFMAALLGYGVGALLVVFSHLRGVTQPSVMSWWLVALGWMSQLSLLSLEWWQQAGQIGFDLAVSLELAALMIGLSYLVGWRLRRRAVRATGLVILPMMLFLMLAAYLLPSGASAPMDMLDPLFSTHLALSLCAYGLFSIAAIMAVLEFLQERALKRKEFGRIYNMLPPLGALEEALFLMIRGGFLLLTLSIFTGGWILWQRHGNPFVFNHKMIFATTTWLIFATLLLGHRLRGWRGGRAVRMTLIGYMLLVLAYIGVKVVTDLIL